MKYGIVNEGDIVCDPIEYDRDRFTSILNRRGAPTDNLSTTPPSKAIICGDYKILPSVTVRNPSPDVLAYTARMTEWTVVDDSIVRTIEWAEVDEETYRKNFISAAEKVVNDLIQSKVDEYNSANSTLFSDVHSCANYATTEGYTHQSFCVAVWAWNVAVWEKCRELLLAGELITMDDLLSQLPKIGKY